MTTVEGTETLRGTGRTTRMLEQAIKIASEGKRVYVIGHTRQFVGTLAEQATKIAVGQGIAEIRFIRSAMVLKFAEGGEVVFRSADYRDIWDGYRIRGESLDTIVLVDHFVIEQQQARATTAQ